MEPKVEDLLATIRKAIDSEDGAGEIKMSREQQGTITRGSVREMRVQYDAPRPAPANTEDVYPVRGRVVRNAPGPGFASPPAPRFRLEDSEPPAAPRPMPAPRSGGFAEILSGQSDVRPAPRPIPPEPTFLRRTQIDENYHDDIVTPPPHEPEEMPQDVPQWEGAAEQDFPDTSAYGAYGPPPDPYSAPLAHQHAAPPPLPPPPQPQQYAPRTALVSQPAHQHSRRSFDDLAEALLAQAGNGRGLEDMTRELLRGYLARWLDDNLPPLVERLVREEIERVARRGA